MKRGTHDAGARDSGGTASDRRYGHFSDDGREYRITDPRPPRPWVNIIANPRFGLAVSQTGSGFCWMENSQLGTITRWQQDLALDSSGRFLYARDADTGAVWSLAPAPVWPEYERYACRHGMGYSAIETELAGIAASWTLLCPVDGAAELWLVELRNTSPGPRRIELTGFVEWCMGHRAVAPPRVPQAVHRDRVRRRAAGRVRAQPHVGRAVAAVRALEHRLPVHRGVRLQRAADRRRGRPRRLLRPLPRRPLAGGARGGRVARLVRTSRRPGGGAALRPGPGAGRVATARPSRWPRATPGPRSSARSRRSATRRRRKLRSPPRRPPGTTCWPRTASRRRTAGSTA